MDKWGTKANEEAQKMFQMIVMKQSISYHIAIVSDLDKGLTRTGPKTHRVVVLVRLTV